MPPIKDFPGFTPLIKFTVGNLVEILGRELRLVTQEFPGVHYCSELVRMSVWQERLNIQRQPSDFFSDGVHPSKFTYQVWAREVGKIIAEKEWCAHP